MVGSCRETCVHLMARRFNAVMNMRYVEGCPSASFQTLRRKFTSGQIQTNYESLSTSWTVKIPHEAY